MSRFVTFSLGKRTDELMRPREKILHKEFNSVVNQQLVFKTVNTIVSSRVSFHEVMDHMEAVFRSALSSDDLPSVEDLNQTVYRRIDMESEQAELHRKRFVNRIYENANVPTTILPRPSMSIDRHEDDESRGKYSIEFTRI